MYNKSKILELYNSVSERKIDQQELLTILPKLYLIINKVKLDELELIDIIDVLEEIKTKGVLEKISPELIDLINKITRNGDIDLDGTLYFSLILKDILLPYDKNICDKDHNLMLFLSEFEIFIGLSSKTLKRKDLFVLDQYNHELKEVIVKYKEAMIIYKQWVRNDVILSQMISHFASIFYFNINDFDKDYDLILELLANIINNYNDFIDYCCSLGIHKNFTRIINDLSGIKQEYIISYNMLKYTFDNKNKEKIKRK